MATPIICLGDSITACFSFPELVRWTTQLQLALNESYPDQYEVYNRGIGGNTTTDVLGRFTAGVTPLLPGVVVIELGFNDASVPEPFHIARCVPAAFKAHLTEIVRLVREGKGHPVLIVNHPIRKNGDVLQFNGKAYIDNYAGYSDIIREVACETATPSIDLEQSMLEAGVSLEALLHTDGLHLTREGNAVYAEHVLRGLKPILESLQP